MLLSQDGCVNLHLPAKLASFSAAIKVPLDGWNTITQAAVP